MCLHLCGLDHALSTPRPHDGAYSHGGVTPVTVITRTMSSIKPSLNHECTTGVLSNCMDHSPTGFLPTRPCHGAPLERGRRVPTIPPLVCTSVAVMGSRPGTLYPRELMRSSCLNP